MARQGSIMTPFGVCKPEIDRFRIGRQQDDLDARIGLGELEGDALHAARHQNAVGIEHHLGVADAGEDLQEVLLQQEAVVAAIAPVTRR